MRFLIPSFLAPLALLFSFHPTANATVTTTGCGGGTSCTMTQLTGGGTITAGSLRFDNFAVLADAGSATVDESTITLTGLDDMGLDPGPGFRLDSNGELMTAGGEDLIYAFSFDVTDVNGESTLKDASLAAGTNAFGFDDFWQVEGRIPASNIFSDIEIIDGTFEVSQLFDTFDFTLTDAITARHNINLDSTPAFATGATLTSYTFRVSQIPEPSTLAMLLLGLAGMAASAKRGRGSSRI